MADVERFEAAVKLFLRRHKKQSIAEMAAEGKLLRQLLIEPSILAYLTRPPCDVEFDEKRNIVFESSAEKAIYKACFTQQINIPYRSDRSQNSVDRMGTNFLHSSSYSNVDILHAEVLGETKNTINKHLQFDPRLNVHVIDADIGVYEVGNMLRSLQGEYACATPMTVDGGQPLVFERNKISLLIFPTGDSGHAFTLGALIDNNSKKVKAILAVDSHEKNDRNKNCAAHHAYHLNRTFFSNRRDVSMQPFDVVDCSIDVQPNSNDLSNCALYRFATSRALLANALHHPELFLALAKQPWLQNGAYKNAGATAEEYARTAVTKEDPLPPGKGQDEMRAEYRYEHLLANEDYLLAMKTAGAQLAEAIKGKMPEYYKAGEGKAELRPNAEVKQKNIETRWRTGNEFLLRLAKENRVGRRVEA